MSDDNLSTKDVSRWQVCEPPPPPFIGKDYGDLSHSLWQLMIEELLKDPTYSISQLAEDTGISRSTLLNMRNKAGYIPHIGTLSRLLGVYCQRMQENNEEK